MAGSSAEGCKTAWINEAKKICVYKGPVKHVELQVALHSSGKELCQNTLSLDAYLLQVMISEFNAF